MLYALNSTILSNKKCLCLGLAHSVSVYATRGKGRYLLTRHALPSGPLDGIQCCTRVNRPMASYVIALTSLLHLTKFPPSLSHTFTSHCLLPWFWAILDFSSRFHTFLSGESPLASTSRYVLSIAAFIYPCLAMVVLFVSLCMFSLFKLVSQVVCSCLFFLFSYGLCYRISLGKERFS